MKTTYTHLLFDLDGTLTDPVEGITRSVQYSLRHFGIEVTDLRSLTPFIGPPLAESFREFYGFDDGRIPEAIRLMREYFSERGWRENRLYDGMPAAARTFVRIPDLRWRSPRRNRPCSPGAFSTISIWRATSPSWAAPNSTAAGRPKPT